MPVRAADYRAGAQPDVEGDNVRAADHDVTIGQPAAAGGIALTRRVLLHQRQRLSLCQ